MTTVIFVRYGSIGLDWIGEMAGTLSPCRVSDYLPYRSYDDKSSIVYIVCVSHVASTPHRLS